MDYYAPLPVTPWIGKTIRLEGNYPEAFYTQIKQADDPAESDPGASADAFYTGQRLDE